MAYLEPSVYASYGLPSGTTADWITAATALINSYCRRPEINITQYTERSRVDTLWLQYFGTTLIDQTVQALLRPYIAKRLG